MFIPHSHESFDASRPGEGRAHYLIDRLRSAQVALLEGRTTAVRQELDGVSALLQAALDAQIPPYVKSGGLR